MTATIKHEGTAHITALSYTKKGADGHVLAAAIKVQSEVDVVFFASIIGGGGADADVYAAFWDHGPEEVDLRFWGIGEITSPTSLQDVRAAFGGLTLSGCAVDKFSFSPKAGGTVDATFTIHVTNPPRQALETLPQLLREPTKFRMYQPQLELPMGNVAPFRPGAHRQTEDS